MRRFIVAACLAACDRAPRPPPIKPPPVTTAPDPLGEASLLADIHWLTAPARAGRGSRSPESRATADWLAVELRTAGYTPQLQPISDLPGQVNVIAAYGATSGPAIVVTAHYDHLGTIDKLVYPGADDNASGVAIALAVARDLYVHSGVRGRIVFVFTGGEELGLLGARAYVAAPTVPLADIRAVYNLDMVGRRFFASSVDEDGKLAAVGLPENADIADTASRIATDIGLTLVAVRAGILTVVGEDRRSDDWMFRDHGVFAVHFSTGLNEDYHEPTDTEDKLSRPQLRRIAKFLRALVEQTAR